MQLHAGRPAAKAACLRCCAHVFRWQPWVASFLPQGLACVSLQCCRRHAHCGSAHQLLLCSLQAWERVCVVRTMGEVGRCVSAGVTAPAPAPMATVGQTPSQPACPHAQTSLAPPPPAPAAAWPAPAGGAAPQLPPRSRRGGSHPVQTPGLLKCRSCPPSGERGLWSWFGVGLGAVGAVNRGWERWDQLCR